MTVSAWRIVKAKHASKAFSAEGEKKYGGRWNSVGVPVIYAAGSASLAMLEMLVHLQSQELLRQYVLFEAILDELVITTVDLKSLPKVWRKSPAPVAVQRIGDMWVAAGGSAVLRVPSAIVPNEWDYLLNPAHPDFAGITIGPKQPVRFDPRLIRK